MDEVQQRAVKKRIFEALTNFASTKDWKDFDPKEVVALIEANYSKFEEELLSNTPKSYTLTMNKEEQRFDATFQNQSVGHITFDTLHEMLSAKFSSIPDGTIIGSPDLLGILPSMDNPIQLDLPQVPTKETP